MTQTWGSATSRMALVHGSLSAPIAGARNQNYYCKCSLSFFSKSLKHWLTVEGTNWVLGSRKTQHWTLTHTTESTTNRIFGCSCMFCRVDRNDGLEQRREEMRKNTTEMNFQLKRRTRTLSLHRLWYGSNKNNEVYRLPLRLILGKYFSGNNLRFRCFNLFFFFTFWNDWFKGKKGQ